MTTLAWSPRAWTLFSRPIPPIPIRWALPTFARLQRASALTLMKFASRGFCRRLVLRHARRGRGAAAGDCRENRPEGVASLLESAVLAEICGLKTRLWGDANGKNARRRCRYYRWRDWRHLYGVAAPDLVARSRSSRGLGRGAGGGLKVAVFEGSDRIGGRLLSARSPHLSDTTAEIGGMRYVVSGKEVGEASAETDARSCRDRAAAAAS